MECVECLECFRKDNLNVKIFETRSEMGKGAAKDVTDTIKQMLETNQTINMVFAAAPSQNEFLEALIQYDVDFSRIRAFHMDEYIGLDSEAPQGFGNFLKSRLFDKAPFKSVHYLSRCGDIAEEICKSYTQLLHDNPIDIVCMGIGENGHIAFNDPHVAHFDDKELVKTVKLDEICRRQQVNDGCFKDIELVPTHAVTLTIPAMLSAEKIFCMVPAATKAVAVKNTLEGIITEDCPASILRKHKNTVLYLDLQSSVLLKSKE